MGFFKIIKKLMPDHNLKKLNAMRPVVDEVNSLAEEYSNLSNNELKNKTNEFKDRISKGATLDSLLPEAFAAVKEASKRSVGLIHYDEQLLAGIALHKGMMTEMKTGEGKTLSATLAVYLNALSGKGVHVATVNDYLAKRDAEEMGRIYSFLGLTCGSLLENMSNEQKQAIYKLDILYATGSTLGFDYLNDNMSYDVSQLRQRDLNFIIVDEADKLIDDGRTPLIISGHSNVSMDFYYTISRMVETLSEEDYELNLKEKSALLSEKGMEKVDKYLVREGVIKEGSSIYESGKLEFIHGINQCLKAHTIYKKDIDYIVKGDQVLLIDEMTGRILDGRRLSDGLHQAIEAKEKVSINNEGSTSASISYQKFFGLYSKFSGMSGTCMSEAEEFNEIYKVDTVSIPTHKKVIRVDEEDEIYADFDQKFDAIIKEVQKANEKQQPVLVITGSVQSSDVFSYGFKRFGLKHKILNARYHKEEAEIIAQAGMPGAITIATNMAGRGTDIQLGGNYDMRVRKLREQGLSDEEILARKDSIKKEIAKFKEVVLEAGGLYVIGTERNESRRVDDQARGRSGRQGDPGKSKFLMSLDDPLMKVFGNLELMKRVLPSYVEKGEPIKDSFITKQMARAQNSIEAANFDSRKYLLKYDKVLDKQRSMIYEFRKKYLFGDDIKNQFDNFLNFQINELESLDGDEDYAKKFCEIFAIKLGSNEEMINQVRSKVKQLESNLDAFKFILLHTIDELWEKHLTQLSYLRQIVNLRAHAQKDPLTEYQVEAFNLFEIFLENFRVESLKKFFNINEQMINS